MTARGGGALVLRAASPWYTPARLSRRYDTHFFMAMSHGEAPELTAEHTD